MELFLNTRETCHNYHLNSNCMSRKVKHAYISPVCYLNIIPKESDIHLLLAHLLTNKEYCDFYREKMIRGDVIIIDNGAFENGVPMNAKEYFDIIFKSRIEPNVIVAPDYPYQNWDKTVNSFLEFRSYIHDYFPCSTKIMGVPQSLKGDFLGWIKCYESLIKNGASWIGMSIIGIPNAFCKVTGTTDISFNRTFAVSYLLDKGLIGRGVYHHFLGCGDPRELAMMQIQGVADSNDSSTAIWHGHLGQKFNGMSTGLDNGKTDIPVDFFCEYNDNNVNIIKDNIKWMEDLIERSMHIKEFK